MKFMDAHPGQVGFLLALAFGVHLSASAGVDEFHNRVGAALRIGDHPAMIAGLNDRIDS